MGPKIARHWSSAALLLPAAVCIGVFYLLPEVLNVALAFTDWNNFRSDLHFVGVDNFVDLGPGQLGQSISITLRFAAVAVVLTNALALALALALERPSRLNYVLRAVFFVPVLMSYLAAGYVWRAILDPHGVVNTMASAVLGAVGLPGVDIAWLGSTDWTIYVLSVVFAWKTYGIAFLIFLAGLMAIPRELSEAAEVEGASSRTVLWRIKLPLLGPAFTFSIVLTVTAALASFDVIMALTRGGPGRSSEVFNLMVLRLFGQGALAYATAVGLVLVLLIALISVPLLIHLRRREVEL